MLMLYTTSATAEVRGVSTDPRFAAASFSLDYASVPSLNKNIENEWLEYLSKQGTHQHHWLNYIKGPVYFALGKFGERISNGFDFAVDSNIPAGGGASSSSALVVQGGAAIRFVNHISSTPEELASDSAMAEWFIGTRGGSMDHKTICLAESANAVLISYAAENFKQVTLPDEPFQWITFFSKPADKGRETMIHYNERAAVSRLLIPAIIARWQHTNSERSGEWLKVIESLTAGSMETLDVAESLLRELPETITLELLERDYPDAFLELQRSFPALFNDLSRWPMLVRARALHHLGEVKRVAIAAKTLNSLKSNSTPESELSAMEKIGELLDESHASLRDLYGVSTDEVENLISIIRSDPHVLGARMMGGGFGGNVLALTTRAWEKKLIERVQAEYYSAQNRNGLAEGSIMVSTPGPGVAHVDLNDLWRETISHINTLGDRAAAYSSNIRAILDSLPAAASYADVWPVIVAAGKGTRATASGLTVPKPVASVLNQPTIVHVLRNIQIALGKTKTPIIIVSPQTEEAVRNALVLEDVLFVVQPEGLGTGDAVLKAHEQLADFDGRTLVVWSTQPVIQPDTFARTARLATLFVSSQMVLPTTFKQRPYAPITRSQSGTVSSAVETHLESAEAVEGGETNIGLFLLHNQTMFEVLLDLKDRYWNRESGRYNRPSGELGFPNELINAFARLDNGVFASPFADWREEQGIKHLDDLKRCEQFIGELLGVRRPGSALS